MAAFLRVPTTLAFIFAIVSIGFLSVSTWLENTRPDIALKRFNAAMERGDNEAAITHGKRALDLLAESHQGGAQQNTGETSTKNELTSRLAEAYANQGDHQQSARLLESVLTPTALRTLPPRRRLSLESKLAQSQIMSGQLAKGTSILASFLKLAGDAALSDVNGNDQSLQALYGQAVRDAAPAFANSLPPVAETNQLRGDAPGQLATARQMVQLGSYYSLYKDHLHASAGLLSTAYQAQRAHLPENARSNTHVTLILAPVYFQMSRYDDAEDLYLRAFHAQEATLGTDAYDLSLYIKGLAHVYEQQGRLTEAHALRFHLRSLFDRNRRRYSDNRSLISTIPAADLTRPVSSNHALPADYTPSDLVAATAYLIPIDGSISSNSAQEKTISISLAEENIPGERDANMPVRLAQLMTRCGQSSKDEVLSLATGFESYASLQRDYDPQTDQPGNVPPGMSEHQLGLSVDINVNSRLMRPSDAAWLCFRENAFQYGFIASLPPGNDYVPARNSYEPWHWRFVGQLTAQLYREVGPVDQPQEFLSNLDCFRQHSNHGLDVLDSASTCLPTKTSPAPLTLTSSSTTSEETLQLATAEKIVVRALTEGPKFAARGRFEEAHILYSGALKALEAIEGPSQPALSFFTGMLADTYDKRGFTGHSTALRTHMARVFRHTHLNATSAQDAQSENNAQGLHPVTLVTPRVDDTHRPVTRVVPLPADYIPSDLIGAQSFGVSTSKDPLSDEMKIRIAADTPPGLTPEVSQNTAGLTSLRASMPARLAELMSACGAQAEGEKLSLRSGYRSYNTQASLFARLRHRGTVTPPGLSEHQTGLAVDIDTNGTFMRETDAAYACFQENAHLFGFILSYPKGNNYLPGNDTFEPWHWRYVGVETAELFHDMGPRDRPQEFLAALECYKQQAESRARYMQDDTTDYCLYLDPALEATEDERAAVAEAAYLERKRREELELARQAAEAELNNDPLADPDKRPAQDPARILNTPMRNGQNR